MEEDKEKQSMATKLVESMDPDRAKAVLLNITAGAPFYESIIDAVEQNDKPITKKKTRKTRSDKGVSKSAVSPVIESPF